MIFIHVSRLSHKQALLQTRPDDEHCKLRIMLGNKFPLMCRHLLRRLSCQGYVPHSLARSNREQARRSQPGLHLQREHRIAAALEEVIEVVAPVASTHPQIHVRGAVSPGGPSPIRASSGRESDAMIATTRPPILQQGLALSECETILQRPTTLTPPRSCNPTRSYHQEDLTHTAMCFQPGKSNRRTCASSSVIRIIHTNSCLHKWCSPRPDWQSPRSCLPRPFRQSPRRCCPKSTVLQPLGTLRILLLEHPYINMVLYTNWALGHMLTRGYHCRTLFSK